MVDEVHLRAVLCTDGKESTITLVHLHHTGSSSTVAVVSAAWCGRPLHLPLGVEVVRGRVETGVTTCSTVGYVPLEEVLIAVVVVGHLSVVVALWAVVTTRVDVCLKDSELLGSSCVDDVINEEPVCVALNPCRWGRCRCWWYWVVSDVCTVGSLVQVLELPVVLDVVASADVRGGCLESAVRCGCAARLDSCCADGGPGAVVDAVEQLDTVGGRCVDTGKIGQLGEEGSLTLNIRSESRVCYVTGGWGIRVRSTGVDNFEVAV